MFKKILFFSMIFALLATGLWAAGNREGNESHTANDPAGFTDTIDTSEKKPGRWNYYIEARDRAGNITRSGPENINIDPASDLPRVSFINPMPRMRVQGNLNIVGIAVDDDGIKSVHLSITRGADGRGEELVNVTAQGTDYWSYLLDTTNGEIWTDGFYTITAWAIDINDLSGIAEYYANGARVNPRDHRRAVVVFNLDRKKPETTITSHEVGALVSGNIRMNGTVHDGNGINSLHYSIDGGNRYLPVRVSQDRRTGLNTWDVSINTRQLEDGPQVIWFQARDGNNTLGTAAHLLFINNTGPTVRIVHPTPDTVVSGVFSIAGFAQHPVGIRAITWKAGTASGSIELIPGNHWWSTTVDLRNQRLNNIDVEVRVEDVSGNVSTARQRYRVDQVRDLPTVTLIEPVPGVLNNEVGLVVRGNAADNDAVESIFYSLNGGAAVEIPCTGYFQFRLPDLAEGTHNIEVWAKDITGVTGPKVAVRGIVVPPALSTLGIANFSSGAGARANISPFFTGMTLRPNPILNPRTNAITGYDRITMQVALRGSAAPASAFVAFGDFAEAPLRFSGSGSNFTASVQVPDNLQDGLNRIRIRALDRQGREVSLEEYIFFSKQQTTVDEYGTQIQAAVPFVFEWARPNVQNDGRIRLGSSDETLIGISSIPLRSVTVSGTGSNNVDAQIDENGRVVLSAIAEGDIGPLTIRVQTDEATQNIPAIRLVAAFTEPIITLQGVNENAWVRTNAPVRFNISSRTRVTSVEYSVDMGSTWTSFGAVAAEYNRNIELGGVDDGSICILIKATNEGGKSAITHFTVQKDNRAPQATLVMPISESRVNGTIRMAFDIAEAGTLSTVTYNRPARGNSPAITREVFNRNNWDADYSPRFLEVTMDSIQMPLDNNMRFVFTDAAGNASEINTWPFVISPEDDIPVVHVILPLENEVITSDFIVSGVAYDDDGIKNIQYRLNNGPWQVMDIEYGFSIPIALSTLTDNEHSVSVFAEDIFGVRSEPVTRRFRVSLSEPTAVMTFPTVNTVLREGVELRGSASDRNGIKEVRVSLDNGNSFNLARGNFGTAAETVQWTYQFNTTILKDGPHVVFIRVIDRYDIPATYASMINVDNTAPEIILDSPDDGSMSTGRINVMGRVLDPNLQEVNIQLRGLDGQQVSNALRSRRLDPNVIVRETLDLAGQPDGHYNIAIIATDKAGNISRVSRNFELARTTYRNFIEVLYPLENEDVSGEFNLYGYAGGADIAETVTIRINGRDVSTNEVDATGYFRFNLNGEYLQEGGNAISIASNFGGGSVVTSRAYNINYQPGGPWVTIDSFNFGDFAYERPYLYGRTGYELTMAEQELLADRTTDREIRAAIQAKTPDFTEISFDNGKTFVRTSGRQGRDIDYRFRLETGEMVEGIHYIVVRTTMRNGEVAVTRMLVQVDKTHPVIRVISPEMGGRYNTAIVFSASATDDIDLVSLTYHLRAGDKAAYEIPGFLQGLYFDVVIPPFIKLAAPDIMPNIFAGGATFMDIGFGLSFFDDNVKIQFQYGFQNEDTWAALGGVPPIRYGGHVIAFKLLASVYALPFASFLGPDFEWLSATFAIGANFSLFDVAGEGFTQSGESTWLSALLFQIEFPRVQIPKRTNFRTFSLFTEGQLWFVPTDVNASSNNIPVVMPKIIMGLRMYIF